MKMYQVSELFPFSVLTNQNFSMLFKTAQEPWLRNLNESDTHVQQRHLGVIDTVHAEQ